MRRGRFRRIAWLARRLARRADAAEAGVDIVALNADFPELVAGAADELESAWF